MAKFSSFVCLYSYLFLWDMALMAILTFWHFFFGGGVLSSTTISELNQHLLTNPAFSISSLTFQAFTPQADSQFFPLSLSYLQSSYLPISY